MELKNRPTIRAFKENEIKLKALEGVLEDTS